MRRLLQRAVPVPAGPVDDNHAHNARAACRAAAVTIAERIDHPTRAWKVEMSRLGEAEVWSGPTIDTIDDVIDMTHNTARLTDAEARTIAAAWNGGDGSALYSFVSTGYIAPGLSEEVLRCRRLAIDLRDKARLNQLLSYLNNSSPRTTPVPGWSGDLWDDNILDHPTVAFRDDPVLERLLVEEAEIERLARVGVEVCNTCDGTGEWWTTTEDSPTQLVHIGPCPDCNPENDNLDAQHRDERGATTDED